MEGQLRFIQDKQVAGIKTEMGQQNQDLLFTGGQEFEAPCSALRFSVFVQQVENQFVGSGGKEQTLGGVTEELVGLREIRVNPPVSLFGTNFEFFKERDEPLQAIELLGAIFRLAPGLGGGPDLFEITS